MKHLYSRAILVATTLTTAAYVAGAPVKWAVIRPLGVG